MGYCIGMIVRSYLNNPFEKRKEKERKKPLFGRSTLRVPYAITITISTAQRVQLAATVAGKKCPKTGEKGGGEGGEGVCAVWALEYCTIRTDYYYFAIYFANLFFGYCTITSC